MAVEPEQARTNAIMQQIANEFGLLYHTVGPSMTRPSGFDGSDAVRSYWQSPITTSRPASTTHWSSSTMHSYLSSWNGWQQPPNYQGVAMDTHIYQMFSNAGVAQWNSRHTSTACGEAENLETFNANQLWTIVGEWTPAMTDCAKYLSRRGVGSRYDVSYPDSTRIGSCMGLTGSGSLFSSSYQAFLRQTWEAQVITYEKASG